VTTDADSVGALTAAELATSSDDAIAGLTCGLKLSSGG
jgi:hypothetical protein